MDLSTIWAFIVANWVWISIVVVLVIGLGIQIARGRGKRIAQLALDLLLAQAQAGFDTVTRAELEAAVGYLYDLAPGTIWVIPWKKLVSKSMVLAWAWEAFNRLHEWADQQDPDVIGLSATFGGGAVAAMSEETVLAVGDLHVCSAWGMVPKGFVLSTGNPCVLNKGQAYLARCWRHAMAQLPEHIDHLLLMGDMAEGQNVKDEARGLTEVEPAFQVRAAVQILEPLAKRCGDVWAVRGSKYHVGGGGRLDEDIALSMGAQKFNGWHATPWLRTDFGGLLFDAAHRQSITMRYRSMPMEREMAFALESAGRERAKPPDVVIRAHSHYGYSQWEDGERYVITTPSFKLMDGFVLGSISPNRVVPWSLGMVLIRVSTEREGHRVRTWPLLYDHPPLSKE